MFDNFVELTLKGIKGSLRVFELIHAPFSQVSIKVFEILQIGAISKFLLSICFRSKGISKANGQLTGFKWHVELVGDQKKYPKQKALSAVL